MAVSPKEVPDFDQLPKVEGMPDGCAWGVFDRDGVKDKLGTLNFLTPEVVKAASKEVQDGVSISLNWPINSMSGFNIPGRIPAEHKVIFASEAMKDSDVGNLQYWDDEVRFNTQGSSQWDSLCHYQHQGTGLAYNGTRPDKTKLSVESSAENELPTLDHWHERGGLVGRGVLLDFARYAEAKGLEFHPFAEYRIKVEELEACASHQGVELRHGDILVLRTTMTEAYGKGPEDVLKLWSASGGPQFAGLHGSVETARWLWNRRFAAVVADNSSLEAYPPVKEDGQVGSVEDLVLHSYMLALFGMPIGELWDLKKLSEYCHKKKRYSFMLTSVPLNVPGLVGSPPNAVAIF